MIMTSWIEKILLLRVYEGRSVSAFIFNGVRFPRTSYKNKVRGRQHEEALEIKASLLLVLIHLEILSFQTRTRVKQS